MDNGRASISLALYFHLMEACPNTRNVGELVLLKQSDTETSLTFILSIKEHRTSKGKKKKEHCLMLYMKFHFPLHNY